MINLKGEYLFNYFIILYSTILAYELYVVLPRFPDGSVTNFLNTFSLNSDIFSRLVFYVLTALMLFISLKIMTRFKKDNNYGVKEIILSTLLALSSHLLFHVSILAADFLGKKDESFQGRVIFIVLYALAVIVSYAISIKNQKK